MRGVSLQMEIGPAPTDVILSERSESKDLLFPKTRQYRQLTPITFDIKTKIHSIITLNTMPDRCYYTYIVASRTRVLYIGVTGNIERRMTEHKQADYKSFTANYKCHRLVWFERYTTPSAAIAREKQLKGWIRAKKIELIKRENPTWEDLSENWGKPIPAFWPNP